MKKLIARISIFFVAFIAPVSAFAQEVGADAYKALGLAIGAGFAIGFAAFGGALGQSKAASAALEGIGRNPGAADKLFTPMIIALALIESLVIYALLIAFMLYGKI
ncbi:MAG: ATP synthase F0 subunit C [Proteobacteria bacterium]|nr:ATP synthase F0 subunit C [Pseudomonadota bacterium]